MPTQDTPVINSPPKLLDQVRDKLRVKHSSIRTGQIYVDWIKRHIRFHDKSHSETTELCQTAWLGQPLT